MTRTNSRRSTPITCTPETAEAGKMALIRRADRVSKSGSHNSDSRKCIACQLIPTLCWPIAAMLTVGVVQALALWYFPLQ